MKRYTDCSKCIFLDKKDQETTCFCSLDKLKFYYKNDIKIIRSKNGTPILEKFICPFQRNLNWKNKDLVKNLEIKEIEELIIKENGFPFACFIFENEDIDIEEAVGELLKLEHKPKYIHVTFRHMHQNEDLLVKLSNKIEEHKIKYKLNINLNKELDHFYESFLVFMLNVQTPFIAFYNKNYKLKSNFTTEISEKIQKELIRFAYANTENKEFVLMPTDMIKEYLIEEGQYFLDRIFETQWLNYKL